MSEFFRNDNYNLLDASFVLLKKPMCISAAIGMSDITLEDPNRLRSVISLGFGDFFTKDRIPRVLEKMTMLSKRSLYRCRNHYRFLE